MSRTPATPEAAPAAAEQPPWNHETQGSRLAATKRLAACDDGPAVNVRHLTNGTERNAALQLFSLSFAS